jgi:hypothetical protein
MPTEINAMLTQLQMARDLWNQVMERWEASGLATDQPYARLYGATMKEFNKRAIATLELVGTIESMDEAGQLLFMPKVKSATAHIQSVRANAEQVLLLLNSQPTGSFKDAANNLENVSVEVGGATVTNVNFAQYVDQINNALAPLSDLASTNSRGGRTKGSSIYLAYGIQLQELAGKTKSLHAEVAKLKDETATLSISAKDSAAAAAKSSQAADGEKTSAAEAAVGAKAGLAEVEAKLAVVRETAQAAGSLQSQVEGYGAGFDAFQESLDGRVRSHLKFESDMSLAMVANRKREDDIDALILKADAMIRGATTAGLSNSLDEARHAYEVRLSRTGWWFLGSVVVLLVCLLPVIGQLIPGPWQGWFKPIAGGNTDPWLATLGKLILLLPATWATAFFANNYAELFHLAREYAHKAAMAKAVDGFKREAPDYKEEIVAGVFMEIRENPGSRKSPDPALPQNPIVQRILEKLLDAIKAKKSEAA